ncbi:MAG: aminopeptidase P family protein [Gemmatimonadales bacterium]
MSAAASNRSLALLVLAACALATPLRAQEGSPGGAVPVASLQARRAAFLATMPKGIAVVEAGTTKSNDLGDYPQDGDYRERANFFYFTGIESPGGRLVFIQPDSGSAQGRVVLYLAAPPKQRNAWFAPTIAADTVAARLTGLAMEQIIAGGGPADGTGPTSLPTDKFVTVADSIATALALPKLAPRVISRLITPLRSIKDEDEIRRLRRAGEISGEAHRAAMLNARPGMWEFEIEAIVEYTFRRRGAERVGYPSIVGSGPNTTTLHYDLSRRQVKPGELVLIDAAAEFGYYSADLTRTFPVDGKFTARQKAIYELVLGAQQAAIDSVRPGTTLVALHLIAVKYMKDHSGTLCGTKSCDAYFIHFLSHPVGLDVHDVGGGAPLQPGMTFTIEPGIYLPEENLGVRIEDVMLVTATGSENLTKSAPRTVAEIEKLMSQGKLQGLNALKP